MKQEIRRPKPGPASSCSRCLRAGTVADNQSRLNGHSMPTGALEKRIRFGCQCGHEWLADRVEAEAHGRFLARLGIEP